MQISCTIKNNLCSMNKIGFHNFRRFSDFKPIEYNDVTFLVGRNNSGKSTLVKALILIDDFLKSDSVNYFSFSQKNVEDVNIVTYGRAKNSSANKKSEDFIGFDFRQDDFGVHIVVSGKVDSTTVNVIDFTITDHSQNLKYSIEPQYGQITYKKLNKSDKEDSTLTENATLSILQEQQKDLKKQIKSIEEKSSSEYIHLNHQLNALKTKIKELKSVTKKESSGEMDFSITHLYMDDSISDIFEDTIGDAVFRYKKDYNEIQKGKKPDPFFADYKAFYNNENVIHKSVDNFLALIKNTRIAYLGASLTKQSALFAIRDKNNALAQAIHEFKQLNVNSGEESYRFLLNWMGIENFDIGTNLEINMHAGEAYEVLIESNGAKIHLADKGMGSIQAMLLILRLATIIHKKQKDKKDYTVIIEEPELNLHPALQSKLTDLFFAVSTEFGIKLIIETHSEYIIRRSQVLVAEKELEIAPNENPFCVFYFPKENGQLPYRMNYNSDGVFDRNFGEGFFDAASSSTLELLKLKRQKLA